MEVIPMTDSILYWNDVALEANRTSHTNGRTEQTGPPLSSRALAIVHLAMYDAYVAVNTAAGLNPYLPGLPTAPAGATPAAAVAGAAYTTLSALFPSQQSFFDTKLGHAGNVLDPGHAFGVLVAQALLLDRAADPSASDTGYLPSAARGHHHVDPDNPAQGFHAPFYGARSKGFAITARHELLPPPLDTPEYIDALREVRGLGIAPELMGSLPATLSKRTVDQMLIGLFWGYDGAAGLGTPPRLYNQIVRRIAIARSNTEAQNARLFALVNVAMADAGILAWDQKYIHDFWRPVVAIREHDRSMGLGTQPKNNISDDTDPNWLPLGAPATNSMNQNFTMQTAAAFPFNQAIVGRLKNFTPPFPAYPSGHATFGAAALHIARRFYGVAHGDRSADTLFDNLDIVSDEFNGVNQDNHGTVRPRHVRAFPDGLWQMIVENGRSRVYLGVHWKFDAFAVDVNDDPDTLQNTGGVPLGLTIAEDIFASGMAKSSVGPRV
jgi:hypothetical protein